jgi:hypothetical protein
MRIERDNLTAKILYSGMSEKLEEASTEVPSAILKTLEKNPPHSQGVGQTRCVRV